MSSAVTVGVNRRRTPNSLKTIVTAEFSPVALHDGIGILTAGEEARFLAVLRDQVRLGQALKQALAFERLDDGAELFFGVEEEQVQEVAEDQTLVLIEVRRRILLRRRTADPVAFAVGAGEEADRRAPASRCG